MVGWCTWGHYWPSVLGMQAETVRTVEQGFPISTLGFPSSGLGSCMVSLEKSCLCLRKDSREYARAFSPSNLTKVFIFFFRLSLNKAYCSCLCALGSLLGHSTKLPNHLFFFNWRTKQAEMQLLVPERRLASTVWPPIAFRAVGSDPTHWSTYPRLWLKSSQPTGHLSIT